MFNSFRNLKKLGPSAGMLKDLFNLQRQLKKERVTVEGEGIKVTVRGDLQIEEVVVDGERRKDLRKILNQALKKVQQQSAQRMMQAGFKL